MRGKAMDSDIKSKAVNIEKPTLVVSHSKLKRSGESLYKSKCPACENGVLLMRRNLDTLRLEKEDRCISCGQAVLYDDLDYLSIV